MTFYVTLDEIGFDETGKLTECDGVAPYRNDRYVFLFPSLDKGTCFFAKKAMIRPFVASFMVEIGLQNCLLIRHATIS